VLDDPDGPEYGAAADGDGDGGAAAAERAAGEGADAYGDPQPGGRAERRRAAKRGGRRAAGGTGTALALPADGEAEAAPASRVEARRAARAAKVGPGVMISQVTGELFITMGVLMLLFVVYQLWYTNVLADEQAGSATNNLQHQWDSEKKQSSDAGEPDKFSEGTVFAIIYIPKLDVKAPIAEGVDKDSILDKGEVGHYSGDMETAMPWDKSGNFALAGHRNTHGEPFRFIDQLHNGDKVVVETKGMYYTYAITSTLAQTSPSNVSVIEPVPPQSGFTKPGRYITLTTCTPQFTSEYRLIKWGKLVAEQPRSKGAPAALNGG
jgi:sortase A